MPAQSATQPKNLTDLVPVLQQVESFGDVLKALQRASSGAVDGAWGSACALAAAAIADRCSGKLVVVLPRLSDVDEFADDMASFLGQAPLVFPAWESLPRDEDVSAAIAGARLRILRSLPRPTENNVIVTSILALMQPVPTVAQIAEAERSFSVGDQIDIDAFLSWLVDRGLARVTRIEQPGEVAMHGGILDVFPYGAIDPLRIEFFGDEIESIRRFDVESQRTVDTLSRTVLTVVPPRAGFTRQTDAEQSASSHFLDGLPDGSWIVLTELEGIVDEGRMVLSRLDNSRGLFSVQATLERCTFYPSVTVAGLAADSMETSCHLHTESVERFTGPKSEVLSELAAIAGPHEHIVIACHNEAGRVRLSELLAESPSRLADRVVLCQGRIARGFRLVSEKLLVLSDHELFGRTELRRVARRRRVETRVIDSFLDLREGNLVVHLTHGVGRYRGMTLFERDGRAEEHLIVEFRDRVQVYVPVSAIHLVQKYVGAAKAAPQLAKVGTSAWARKKQKAAQGVADLAADMLRLQAAREARPGIGYAPDSHWQKEFDASFPYIETDDQVEAIDAVKQDIERPRPMDRLICGDVGYGKTEVAMRAAFKIVDAGKQVAILVPTTVLAEQHFRTLTERMAEYPITIESLSRFKTRKEQGKVLEGMQTGSVDIVIGTHRLVQSDVRFHDLGLIVIDEEQRFGVEAKEMLKRLRLEVDVLTLSATPIPRTLHMALLGIRDISNLETPPQDRMAIVTRVCRFDPELIRHAIVRELNRNGQVYFVHNRVHNIQSVAERVQQIVPEADIQIAHGQMAPHQLESAMLRFVSGQTDVLVCTTIIESGLDIPNANTIFIHCADRFGLADLHQLRGRVGRYKNRAYCYLLLEAGRIVTPTAAKRLKAIEEFSELGAGFKIAMRDLEIRGAGNILGTEQSGHIAAVGYELYCHLLENAVRRLKNLPVREYRHVHVDLPIVAHLPGSYVASARQKIEIYRKLTHVQAPQDLKDVETELRDRFGPLPEETLRLLDLRELQLYAAAWTIQTIRMEDGFLVFEYQDRNAIGRLASRHVSQLRIVDAKDAYLVLPERLSGEKLLSFAKSMLQPN